MDLISVRDLTKEQVVTISRDLLRQAYGVPGDKQRSVAAKIYEGITDDRILGDCPKCGKHKIRVIRSKATKKRFVGCEGYPDCDQTYPLPQRGDIIGTEEICPQCGTPKIKVLGGRRPWILCLDPYCPTKAEYREKQAARAASGKTTGTRGKAQDQATAKTGDRGQEASGRRQATTRQEGDRGQEPTARKTTAQEATTQGHAAAANRRARAAARPRRRRAATPRRRRLEQGRAALGR